MVTKFYNESKNLTLLVRNISKQKHRPIKIIFIDDGSIDGSGRIAQQAASAHGFDSILISMPHKSKGNLDTLGRAWNKAQPVIKQEAENVDYFALADVDTRFPQYYFGHLITFLENNPQVGVVSGQIKGEKKRSFPMFTGKVVRCGVMKAIDKYWDISVDSFINVKALKLGYQLKVLDNVQVCASRSHLTAESGRIRAGRLAYYAGVKPIYAVLKGIAELDSNFLRGYWSEFCRGTWQTTDEDILEYYQGEFLRKGIRLISNLFS